jgi:hypothetical protein
MLKRRLHTALACAALLLASAPSAALAQTLKAAPAERGLAAPGAERRPELRALFSESVAKAKAGASAGADFKRLEARRLQDDPQQPPPKEKWDKKTKAFVVILFAVVVGVSVWAIANPGDDPPPDCFNDPSNSLCQ